jgi:hypothetical protein
MKLSTIRYNTAEAVGYVTFFEGHDKVYYVLQYSHETPNGNGIGYLDFFSRLILPEDDDKALLQVLDHADDWGTDRNADIIIGRI